jgi:hypothetical protein
VIIGMVKKIFVSLILGLAVLLSACTAAPSGSVPVTGATASAAATMIQGGAAGLGTAAGAGVDVNALPPAVSAAVQQSLALGLSVQPSDVAINTVEQASFSDACLGLPKSGESCAQMITPGYLLKVTVKGAIYEVHASQDGSNVRWK